MKCPNDGAVLTMSERGGVEIDYCPECRGVWLDRGELDKILDRAAAEAQPAAPPPPGAPLRLRSTRTATTAPSRRTTSAATTGAARATASRSARSTGSPSSSTDLPAGQD